MKNIPRYIALILYAKFKMEYYMSIYENNNLFSELSLSNKYNPNDIKNIKKFLAGADLMLACELLIRSIVIYDKKLLDDEVKNERDLFINKYHNIQTLLKEYENILNKYGFNIFIDNWQKEKEHDFYSFCTDSKDYNSIRFVDHSDNNIGLINKIETCFDICSFLFDKYLNLLNDYIKSINLN